jgi:Na+-translocating ferredoxin:NAD+ oxidoreductase RnfG subunit
MKSNVLRFAFILMMTCGGAIAAVSVVFGICKPIIEKGKERTMAESLALAFNMTKEEFADYKVNVMSTREGVPETWEVLDRNNNVFGYAARGAAPGYAGDVGVIASFKKDFSVLIGAFVTDVDKETPGLGKNAIQKKPTTTWLQTLFGVQEIQARKGKPLDEYTFLYQFQDRDLNKLVIAKTPRDGVVAMSGATITSQAVINAVKNARKKIREQLAKRAGGGSAGEPAN